jgi:hypothetical protein
MSLIWVSLAYGLAFVLALAALYKLRSLRWYWHAASVALALALGLMPPPAGWSGPRYDLAVGFFFILFLTWGIGSPLLRLHFPPIPRPRLHLPHLPHLRH